ncbi:MAG: type II toxin-antitoxin system Phd/YefM family antitoxin [Planctomycetes bacterium]|nr:type II toxin-antitoxin system Phd/YefM family antitoxin [Planctomycetota bacterium]
MTRIPVTRARKTLSDVVSHVAFGGERVVLSRNGKDLAVIVSMEVYRRIEAAEDRADLADLERAKRAFEESGEAAIPYEVARKRLGLEPRSHAARRKRRRRS